MDRLSCIMIYDCPWMIRHSGTMCPDPTNFNYPYSFKYDLTRRRKGAQSAPTIASQQGPCCIITELPCAELLSRGVCAFCALPIVRGVEGHIVQGLFIKGKCFSRSKELLSGPWTHCNGTEENLHTVHQGSQSRGVTKRCRLSWLTNSALLYEPKCGGGGIGN
jgi:hypothetical protein